MLFTAAIIASATLAQGTVALTPIPKGATQKLGGYSPVRLQLKPEPLAGLRGVPSGLKDLLYGLLPIAGREVSVVIGTDSKNAQVLLVDANGNKNLGDDPKTEWTARESGTGDAKTTTYFGSMTIDLSVGKAKNALGKVSLGCYRFDPNDPQRKALANVLLYYSDYAYEGKVTLGDTLYTVLVTDPAARAEFGKSTGTDKPAGAPSRLMIDVNGNGKFDARGESYDLSKPFNIGGTTYELSIDPAAGKLTVARSSQTVAEILPPPDLSPGQPAVSFTAKTVSGKEISFPQSYKGKVVMLDFWATWCGPCRAEIPHLVAAYEKFHGQGFEVLGISLDQENALATLQKFTTEQKMTWEQVYDGKFWEAEIADLYVVRAIPAAYLVDGDTGKILAEGNSLRGESLATEIEKALKAKSSSH